MTAGLWEKIKEVLKAAIDLPADEQRKYLEEACANDPALASEVNRLLKSHSEAEDFMNQPLVGPLSALQTDEVVVNRYRVIRQVGRGGMGEVYEVHDEVLNETVAMKTLHPEIAFRPDYVRRFNREIQLARKVTHPNVCRVYDVGEFHSGGLHFFTMEFLHGETLIARIRKQQQLSKREAFAFARHMALGLAAAHELGIVHTDFKSGNVMLCPGPGGERAVITDFGLARFDAGSTEASQTETASTSLQLAGTLGYMSPEQLTGGNITTASDIYSFGIVLYEMATGTIPFDSSNPIRAAAERMSVKEVSARSKVAGIAPRWDEAIARCLQQDPKKRFPSAAALADWFAESRWQWPFKHWTRREWARAISGGGAAVSGAVVAWSWLTQPYQPNPEGVDWYRRGVEALHSMTFDAARKLLERAVEADPKFVLAHASLARAYEEMDYSDLAKESMLRAVTQSMDTRLSSTDQIRLRALQMMIAHDYDRAVPFFHRLEELAAEQEKSSAALESGWLAQLRDKTDEAASAYERAVKLDATSAAAKLRLGFIQGRQNKLEAAFQNFTEAEKLYDVVGDYEGVLEALLQRANLLNRRSRAAEALPVIGRGLSFARAVGNPYQEIRLHLQEGVSIRNLGDAKRAEEIAQSAISDATTRRMDNLAASGSIDLANALFVRGDHKAAEPIYRRALDLARRSKVIRQEIRARSSLGSLCAEDGRPEEARQHLETALPFYRGGGYRRESVQVSSLLGSVLGQLAEFEDSARILGDGVLVAAQLQDRQLEAQVRERLGDNLRDLGNWPKALAEYEKAVALLGTNPQGGYARVSLASLYWSFDRRQDAERSLAEAERLQKTSQNQKLLALIIAQRAWIEYASARLARVPALVRQGLMIAGRGEPADRSLSLLGALAQIRSGQSATGANAAGSVISRLEHAKLIAQVAAARLAIAEAWRVAGNRNQAAEAVGNALQFFEAKGIWESALRGRLVAAWAASDENERRTHRTAAETALSNLKDSWPAADLERYQKAAKSPAE
ncbi:MAG TPA: protein kinase [Bryobacteraceae bacterium]|nr:protein kinase [Bryobacteraceae bacterium]